MTGKTRGKPECGAPAWVCMAAFLVLILLLLIAAPVSASASPGETGTGDSPGSADGRVSVQDAAAVSAPAHLVPDPALRIRPTPTPTPQKQNRIPILPLVVKNAAERPKVTLPATWFIIIVAVALIGLAAILYIILRRRGKSSSAPQSGKAITGTATIIDPLAHPGEPSGMRSSGYPEPAVLFPPSLEKRFTSLEFIGEGGLARVFRARNARTGEMVAVKIPVRFDEVTGTHFTRDIVFWQGLEHENIIRIYSSNILPVPYIEMEYAPSSLASLPLPQPEEHAVRLILGIARGLACAHAKGIVHRDIKPENILLSTDGTPKITDWGLGKALGDSRQSIVIGFSPTYAAPEQIAPHRYGRPGPATDIYQLGMLLCELLTGTVAFGTEGLHDLNMAILNEEPVIPSWKGQHEEALRQIILTCLSKHPEERYGSVDLLIRELEFVQSSP